MSENKNNLRKIIDEFMNNINEIIDTLKSVNENIEIFITYIMIL